MQDHLLWDPLYSVGNEVLDNQHKAILAQCNALGDIAGNPEQEAQQLYRADFYELLTSVREHFSTEEALLSIDAHLELDELREALDEFEYLAADIITIDNFEMSEIQRFMALWWVGHLIDSAKKYRALS
jgi:hemerythrin